MTPFSDATFYWMLIFMITSIAIGWFVYDSVGLRRDLKKPPAERSHDLIFGRVIGILLALSGGFGYLKHVMGW